MLVPVYIGTHKGTLQRYKPKVYVAVPTLKVPVQCFVRRILMEFRIIILIRRSRIRHLIRNSMRIRRTRVQKIEPVLLEMVQVL